MNPLSNKAVQELLANGPIVWLHGNGKNRRAALSSPHVVLIQEELDGKDIGWATLTAIRTDYLNPILNAYREYSETTSQVVGRNNQ